MRRPLACLVLLVPCAAAAQRGDAALRARRAQAPSLHALRGAEDARARTPEQLATLRAGLRAPAAETRRVAARGVGRLRRADLVADLAPLLDDPAAEVRAAAAIALLHASAGGGAAEARAALVRRLPGERSHGVVGAIAEALGWTSHDSAAVAATAEAIVAHSRERAGEAPGGHALWGVAHGLFGLARQPAARRALPAAAVARLRELQTHRRRSDARQAAEVRELATLALAAGAHVAEADMMAALDDPDRHVRAAAARGVALLDTAAAARVGARALGDPAWQVRAVAVGALGQRFGRAGCGYAGRALMMDTVVQVRLAAVDAMAGGCDGGQDVAPLLDALAGTLPAPRGSDAGAWHLPAHALLSLAALDAGRARARIPAFAASPDFFVREYAARAADRAADTASLRRLAGDAHPNVRAAAIAGLSRLVGRAGEDLYLAALSSDDSQLLQAAAAALEAAREERAGPRAARAGPALLDALDRLTRRGYETDREARLALLQAVRLIGYVEGTRRVRGHLTDFDSLVARRAAETITSWSDIVSEVRPRPLAPLPVPSGDELARLARSRVEITMEDGGTFAFGLFAHDAPTNAARVARLAREGRLDGLTFHRAVIPRFVQGGSPGANEYAGWGRYTRDELGRPNRRGAILMSTRGYDTADGQFVPETANNFGYDHQYTVIGEVVAGIEVVDRLLEGARIRRARVVEGGAAR